MSNSLTFLSLSCSVRELVNVVRHLGQYPQDGVALALDNVLSMDTRTLNTQLFPGVDTTSFAASFEYRPNTTIVLTQTSICFIF